MLSDQMINDLAGFMKITPASLKAAIEAKEEKPIEGLDLTKLQVFTPEEISQRDEHNKTAGKGEITKAAREILIKELKQESGLEFEGKDPKTFVVKLKEKTLADAKLAPSQREQELQSQITVLTSARDQALQQVSEAKAQYTKANLERALIASFPANVSGDLNQDERLLLFNARYEAQEVDGVRVWKDKHQGQELRDKQTGKPLADKDVIAGFFQEKKWTGGAGGADPKGGRGGGSEGNPGAGSGKPSKYSEARKEWTSQGKNINAAEFATYVAGLKKDNSAFVMDYDTPVE